MGETNASYVIVWGEETAAAYNNITGELFVAGSHSNVTESVLDVLNVEQIYDETEAFLVDGKRGEFYDTLSSWRENREYKLSGLAEADLLEAKAVRLIKEAEQLRAQAKTLK